MDIETIRSFLLWCFVLNMGLLLWWFLFLIFAHDFVYRMHTKWFPLSVERFDAIHYAAMTGYKITIFVFFLMPYVALTIVS